jgi:Transposase DDE domain
MPSRRIVRDVNEDARDIARRKMKTKAFLKSRDQRKRVEMRFAHLKTHHGFERMRLRGLPGARDAFHLAAIVQNLKTMARTDYILLCTKAPMRSMAARASGRTRAQTCQVCGIRGHTSSST